MKASGVVTVNLEDYEEYRRAMAIVGTADIEDLPGFLTHKVRAVRVYAGRRMDELQRDVSRSRGESI